MDLTTVTPMQLVLMSALIGLVVGLVPLITGIVKKNLKYGLMGFAGSIVGGAALGLILAVPIAAIFTWLIVRSSLLDRLDSKLGEKRRNLRAFVVSATFFLVSAVLSLPWTIYSGWWRETNYGRTSQPLGDYLGQAALSTVSPVTHRPWFCHTSRLFWAKVSTKAWATILRSCSSAPLAVRRAWRGKIT